MEKINTGAIRAEISEYPKIHEVVNQTMKLLIQLEFVPDN